MQLIYKGNACRAVAPWLERISPENETSAMAPHFGETHVLRSYEHLKLEAGLSITGLTIQTYPLFTSEMPNPGTCLHVVLCFLKILNTGCIHTT